MKNYTSLSRWLFISFLTAILTSTLSMNAWGQLLTEEFNFTGALTSNGWSAHSGGGTNALSTTTGLTYSGYASSGIGNAVQIGNAGGEDDNQGFTEQNVNGTVIYYSFLVNVTDAATSKTGDYFLHIGDRASSTSFTSFAGRVFARIVSSNVNFGLSNTSTATYGSTNFSKSTMYLLIVKYTINSSGNDETKLWVVSSGIPASEVDAGTAEVTNTATAGQDVIDAIGLRQGSSTTSVQVVVDGIRIANLWSDAVAQIAAPTATTNTASSIAATTATLNGTVTAGWASTTVTFDYGTTTSYTSGPVTADQSPVTGNTNTAVSKAVSSLSPNTLYHFRVVGMNSQGTTNGSDVTFTTLPSAPNATAATSATTTSFVANWTSGTGGADSYKLDVATEAGFSSLVAGYNDLAVAGTSQNVTGLTPGQTYYYRVRAVGAGGTSDNSNTIIVSSNSNSSDIIIDTEIIPLTISSLVDTQPEEQGMFFIKVRDGGVSQNDGDAVGTIVNSLRVVKGSSNTVPDWSAVINEARLFKGATLLGVATLHQDSLTWTGTPLFTVTDNHRDSITVKLHLKTTLPAGSDSKKFEFKINQNANVTVDGAGSQMASGGSDVVGSPGTTIDVTATKLQFVTQPPASVNSGQTFTTSVSGADANGNTDGDYATNVVMAKATGTGTFAGTLTKVPVSGVASFTDLTITGSGSHSLIATSGSLTSATSNTFSVLFIVPGVFKVAGPSNVPKNSSAAVGDTLYWDTPSTWTMVSGASVTGVPGKNDTVILDHTFRAGKYTVAVGPTNSDSAKQIIVGYVGNPDTVALLIPSPSSASIVSLAFGDGVAGNYDFIVSEKGVVRNCKLDYHTSMSYKSTSDSIWIRTGGLWYHATNGFNTVHRILSRRFDGDYGTIEFDVPTVAGMFFDISGGGNYWYPHVVLSNTQNAPTYYWFGTGATTIKGNLTVNPGAKDSMMLTGYPFLVYGNIINNGTIIATTSPLVFAGSSTQTVSGSNPMDLGSGLVTLNPNGVNLLTNVNVTGGTVKTTGTFTYDSTGGGINATRSVVGTINTGSSTAFLNPSGSLDEGTNPVQGNVSATRTANQSTNEVFGNIGFEINAAAGAPGSTTILRKTGVVSTGNGNQSIKRYFDVTPTNNAGLNATIGFSYAVSELNSIPEANLLLHKSVDGGTTWSGQTGTVNTALHKITATGVNNLSRWTAASNSALLFIAHTVTIRKLDDADGNFVTTGDRTARKWKLSLYKDSISTSTLINTGNPVNGVLTTLVAGGTYFAVEEDSAGWLRLGKIRHGTSLGNVVKSDTARYDTFAVSDVNPGSVDTVDFVNHKVAVGVTEDVLPTVYSLSQNYPNPFNPSTTFDIGLPQAARLEVAVYSVFGQKVATLVDEDRAAGYHTVVWNGTTREGVSVASGVYFVRMNADEFTTIRKVTVLK